MRSGLRKSLSVLAASYLAAATAAAQPEGQSASALLASLPGSTPAAVRAALQARIEAVNDRFRATHDGKSPSEFGLECCQITQIPAAAFGPSGAGPFWEYLNPGYYYQQLNAPSITAPISLPTGAEIEYVGLYGYDTNDTHAMVVQVKMLEGGGADGSPPSDPALLTFATSGAPGFGYTSSDLVGYTVNNNVAYDPAGAQLVVEVGTTYPGPSMAMKAVDVWWMRQVSPAPATATFADVPTTHPFFQFVEALAASGVTAGCGGGSYCPDSPLTRGQMAVFLSKALGLHWPL